MVVSLDMEQNQNFSAAQNTKGMMMEEIEQSLKQGK